MLTFHDTLKYLDSFTNHEKTGFGTIEEDFDLGKIERALRLMGEPQKNYKNIHVAGTKGKGSVSTFVSAILRKHEYKTGLFTSPHINTPLERISVDGENVGENELVHTVEHIRQFFPKGAEREFTFFEMYTLIAMVYFSMCEVDFAVFETGLGGRLDATNVLDKKICILTPISMDHSDILGESIEEIASEKCGIIKKNTKCFSASQTSKVLSIVKQRCSKLSVPLEVVGENVLYRVLSSDMNGTRFNLFTPRASYQDCKIEMLGSYQSANAALAIAAVEELIGKRRIKEQLVKNAVSEVYMPARMEIIAKGPLLVLDGAQNQDSARSLGKEIKEIFKGKRLVLVAGLSGGKDFSGFMKELDPLVDEVILTKSTSPRAADPNLLRGYLARSRANVTWSVQESLGLAFKIAGREGVILVAGSFYLASDVRRLLVEEKSCQKYSQARMF